MTHDPPAVASLDGSESFDGLDATVADFWRFAMSDLRANTVRGYLAEFLVARAVGATGSRIEWDAWDVTAPDGTRIEVKASAFLQSWAQPSLSRPTFRVAAASSWIDGAGWSANRGFNAQVYVFCLHHAKTHEEYDPLDVSRWHFYVADRAAVAARAGASMGLTTLTRIAGDPVTYGDLAGAIRRAAGAEREG